MNWVGLGFMNSKRREFEFLKIPTPHRYYIPYILHFNAKKKFQYIPSPKSFDKYMKIIVKFLIF